MNKLLRRIRKMRKGHRMHRTMTLVVSVITMIIVFVNTFALIVPAVAAEKNAVCGMEQHQHTDDCYEEELICGLQESEGHQHTDSCYTAKSVLYCDVPVHEHDENCYDENGELICETEEHVHGDSCYREERELTCGMEESEGHTHDASCYEKKLVCGKEVHTHGADCYPDTPAADEGGAVESAAVASTQAGSAGAGTGSESDSDTSYSNSSVTETAGDAGTKDNELTVEVDDAEAGNTADGNTAENGLPSESYVPVLDALDFDTVLDRDTGVYFYAVSEGEVVEDSGLITDWKKVGKNTELAPSDLIRVYLAYTIPAGSLNETNPTARYRLPSSLRLTDSQVEGINAIENGITAQYSDDASQPITDDGNYEKYRGAEATEGIRTPDQDVNDYLRALSKSGKDAQEYISATVKVENVYDRKSGDYLGQDLVFTFSPYTIEKNRHEYDAAGNPTKAGEKVQGWITLDFNMDQVDWSEPVVEEVTEENAPAEDASAEENTGVRLARQICTSEILFVPEGRDARGKKIKEISTELKMVEEIQLPVEENGENTENIEKTEENAETNQDADGSAEGDDDASQDAAADNATADAAAAATEEQAAEDPASGDQDKETIVYNREAVQFDDSIEIRAGSLRTDLDDTADNTPQKTRIHVHVEAEKGTFPEGTTMELHTVDDMDAVAEAVEGAVEGRTRGFHAVDISFHDANGKEVEPINPIRVSMTSESIQKAVEDSSTAPVVVHIEDQKQQGEAEKTGEETEENVEENGKTDAGKHEKSDSSDSADNHDKSADPVVEIVETLQGSADPDSESNADATEGNDTLTFEAGSFSVYAIVYTVDFTYGDQEYHIQGGGKILLSDLFSDLNMDVDVASVENVEFSNSNLIAVTRLTEDTSFSEIDRQVFLRLDNELEGEDRVVSAPDWVLTSLAPFKTKESLVITLHNGDQFIIHVTDDEVTNLAEFVTDATIDIDGTIYGEDNTWIVREGVDYALTLTFKESGSRQFPEGEHEMVMKPADLGGLHLVPGQTGSFDIPMGLYGTVEGNTWWVDDDGELHVKFGKDPNGLLTRSNKTHMDIQFNVKFSGENGIIEFNDRVVRPWKANTETDVSVNKSGYYDAASGKMKYTITVTSTGNSKNVIVTDTFASTRLLTLDETSITINPGKELDTEQSVTRPSGFTRVIKEMTHNETVTITYTASVKESELGPGGKVVEDDGKNTVRVEDDDHHDEKTHIVNEIKFSDLSKVSTSSEVNEDGTVTLNWKITANTDRIASLVGSKITDKISWDSKDIMHYAVDEQGRVKLHVVGTDANGTSYEKDIYVTPSNNDGQQGSPTWTWKVENIEELAGTPLSYEITYQTIADKQLTASVSVKNEAENESGGSETGTGIVPGPVETINTKKEAVQVEEDYVEWTIVVNIPEDGFDHLEVVDTLPSAWSKSGLEFFKDTIVNLDEDVSVLDPEGQAFYTKVYDEKTNSNAAATLTIKFFRENPDTTTDPQKGIAGPARTITIKIRTKNNQNWIDEVANGYDAIAIHENTAAVNNYTIKADASPAKKTIRKNHVKAADTTYNGLPCFAYEVILSGVKEAEDVSFTDTFNSEYLALVPVNAFGPDDFKIGGSDHSTYGWQKGETVQREILEDGTVRFYAESIPLKENESPYGYYRVPYYLYVKSPEALKQLQSQAIANRGKYPLKNTALWGDLPSECEVDYEYGPVTKEGYFASIKPDERKYTFVIDVNPNRYKLSKDGSETIELSDEHTSNLTVDYSSVKIYQIPEGTDISNARTAYESGDLDSYELPRGSIPWNFSGNDGVFYLSDETHYVVVYDAIVIGSGTQNFSNVAELEGFVVTHENSKTYSGEAHAGGEIWEINLLKYKDGMTSNGLEGATFQLFRGTGEFVQVSDDQGNTWWEEQKEPMKYGDTAWTRGQGLVGENITFTTGENGIATIRLEQPIHGNEIEGNVHYFLKEIDSPPGYQIDSSVEYWAFTLTTHPDEVNYGDPNRPDEYGNRQWIYFYYNDILKMANTETTEPLDVEVNKSWFDENGDPITEENLDDTVKATIQLMRKTNSEDYVPVKVEYDADGKPTVTEVTDGSGKVELNSDNQWAYIWKDLPRVKMEGDNDLEIVERYAYKVEEIKLDGYVLSVEETETETVKTYALKNYKKPNEKDTEVTVEKNWQDSDGNAIKGTVEKLPDDIQFYLYQVVSTTPFTTPPRSGGAKYQIPGDTRLVDPDAAEGSDNYGLYRVRKTEGWTTTFEDLPEIRNIDGTTFYYGYYVRELPMEGYTVTYTYDGTTRTIVNREPLPPDNKYINIGLEKKWVSGDNTVPPAGASATFTVHQQKSEKIEAQGTIPVYIVDDKVKQVSSIMTSEGDVLVLDFVASIGAGSPISIRTDTGWNVKQYWVSSSGSFQYTVNENDIVDGSITFKLDSSGFVEQCTEGPYFTNTSSSGSLSTYSEYADTSWTREITLPTTAGSWSTTIKDLIQEDADGNRYRYFITEDTSTPTASGVSFKDDLGKDINHAISTSGQKVEVTNTYETFEFSKIWKNIGGQPTAWPTGATITVTMNAYTDTSQRAIEDVQVTLGAEGSAPGVKPKWTAKANADGTVTTFKVEGLPKYKNGEELHYYVVETQVNGYKAPSYAASDGTALVFTGSDVPKATTGQQIINEPESGTELPSTGGTGTRLFTTLGSILILGTGVLLWRRRRLIRHG